MIRKTLITCMATLAMGCASTVIADDEGKHKGYFKFKSLTESANSADWDTSAPWKLPKGFTQKVISDETDLNIYDAGLGCDDWHDMNVVNETGENAGRYMYRTHEVRLDTTPDNACEELILEEGGSVSVVDLKTGESKLLAQDPSWNALDGIRWTPWGTVVFAEETTGGRFFEAVLNEDMMSVADVIARPAVGLLALEVIDFEVQGNLYVVDELRGRTSTSECDGYTDS